MLDRHGNGTGVGGEPAVASLPCYMGVPDAALLPTLHNVANRKLHCN